MFFRALLEVDAVPAGRLGRHNNSDHVASDPVRPITSCCVAPWPITRFKLRDLYKETGQPDLALEELDTIIDENR